MGGPTPGALTLDDAVGLALRKNPALEVARRELNVALVGVDRMRPGFRPEVMATASQLVRTPRVDLPGKRDDVVLPNSISRFEIGVRQPLYQFGAGRAPAARAAATAGAARSDYRQAELDTVLEVREAFLTVLHAGELARVAARGEELARANLAQSRLLEERGIQAEVDVLQAERAAAEADAARLRAANGVALARANLNRLLGQPIDAPLEAGPAGELPPDPGPLTALLGRAGDRRPELTALRHNIQAAEAGVRLARAARLPRVDLEAAYALQTETALLPHSGIGAGISVTAPIFNGAASRHTVREAEERLAQARSALAAREGGVALEIERERLAMQEARARIDVARRAEAAAEKAYEITRAKLELGRAIQVEVESARLALERALGDRATAEHDLRTAAVRLDRAIGEGPPGEAPPRRHGDTESEQRG